MDVARKERGSRYSHLEGLLRRLTGRRRVARREQLRGGGAPGARDARPRQGGHRLARRADRDRRRVPHPGHHAPRGRGAARGRHDQPHAPEGLCRGHRARRPGCSSRCTRRTTASSASPRPCRSAELVELGRAHGVPVMEDLGSGLPRGSDALRLSARADRARGRGGRRGPRVLLRRQAPGRPAGGDRRGARRPGRAPRQEPAQPRAAHRQVHGGGARGHALRLRGGRCAHDHPDAGHAHRAARVDPASGRAGCSGGSLATRRTRSARRSSNPARRSAAAPCPPSSFRRPPWPSARRPARPRISTKRCTLPGPPVLGRLADDRLLLDCRTIQEAEVPVLGAHPHRAAHEARRRRHRRAHRPRQDVARQGADRHRHRPARPRRRRAASRSTSASPSWRRPTGSRSRSSTCPATSASSRTCSRASAASTSR